MRNNDFSKHLFQFFLKDSLSAVVIETFLTFQFSHFSCGNLLLVIICKVYSKSSTSWAITPIREFYLPNQTSIRNVSKQNQNRLEPANWIVLPDPKQRYNQCMNHRSKLAEFRIKTPNATWFIPLRKQCSLIKSLKTFIWTLSVSKIVIKSTTFFTTRWS